MIIDEIRSLSATSADIRKFAFLVGGVLLALGALALWKSHEWGYYVLGVAALLIILGALAPPVLKPVYYVWMSLALVMGMIMTTLILGILFYLVITPMGLMMRLFGRDPMHRHYGPASQTSYWIPRKEPEGELEYDRQF